MFVQALTAITYAQNDQKISTTTSDNPHLVTSSSDLQSYILAYCRCSSIRTRLVSLLLSELGPVCAFGDGVVHEGFLEGAFDATGQLQAL